MDASKDTASSTLPGSSVPEESADDTVDSEAANTSQSRPWWKKKRFIVPISVFVLFGVIGSITEFEKREATPKKAAAVREVARIPNVVGKQLDEAHKDLDFAGLKKVKEVDRRGDRKVVDPSSWVVVDQSPWSGEVEKSAEIILGVEKKSDQTTTTESTTTTVAPETTIPPTTEPVAAPAPKAAPAPAPTTAGKVVPRRTPPEESEFMSGDNTLNPQTSSVHYKNCTAARAAGAAPIYRGEPGYRAALDRDNDGVACE